MQFLLHFKEQFRLWESLSQVYKHIPKSTRMAILMRVVEGIADLHCVCIMKSVITIKNGNNSSMDYEVYFELLLDAAHHHHDAISNHSKKHHVHLHDIIPDWVRCKERKSDDLKGFCWILLAVEGLLPLFLMHVVTCCHA